LFAATITIRSQTAPQEYLPKDPKPRQNLDRNSTDTMCIGSIENKDAGRLQNPVPEFIFEANQKSNNPKRRRRNVKRTPKKPKRAKTAYNYFQMAEKARLTNGKVSTIHKADMARYIGRRWKALSPEERALFQRKANTDKKRFDNEEKLFHDYIKSQAPKSVANTSTMARSTKMTYTSPSLSVFVPRSDSTTPPPSFTVPNPSHIPSSLNENFSVSLMNSSTSLPMLSMLPPSAAQWVSPEQQSRSSPQLVLSDIIAKSEKIREEDTATKPTFDNSIMAPREAMIEEKNDTEDSGESLLDDTSLPDILDLKSDYNDFLVPDLLDDDDMKYDPVPKDIVNNQHQFDDSIFNFEGISLPDLFDFENGLSV